MISIDDIEDMCCISRPEIAALAEAGHLNTFDAAMLGEYLMHLPKGPQVVHQIICNDIKAALHRDELDHARELFAVLRGFLAEHPEALRGVPG